jgi:uncharacterized protein
LNVDIARAHCVFLTRVGSELYGTSLDGAADHDEIGVCIEPDHVFFGPGRFDKPWHYRFRDGQSVSIKDRAQPGDIEGKIYGLHHFAQLLAKGNPSIVETMFVPKAAVLAGLDLWESFARVKYCVRNKATLKAYVEYGKNQFGRLQERGWDKAKRPDLVEQYGYDTKFAYHAYRILQQGADFATTGTVQIPLNDDQRAMCLAIRTGQYTWPDICDVIQPYLDNLQRIVAESTWPDLPDGDAISDWTRDEYQRAWRMERQSI